MTKLVTKYTVFLKLRNRSNITGFTLIEVLIVIAILGVLVTAVVLVLNPQEIIRRARDAKRLQDIQVIASALRLSEFHVAPSSLDGDGPNFTNSCSGGSNQRIFVSVPDDNGESPPIPPSGWSYQRASSSVLKEVDGDGWLPVDFVSAASAASVPFSVLPVDPLNTFASGYYYSYTCGSFEVNARFESERFQAQAQNDGGDDPAVYEVGSLTLFPQLVDTNPPTPNPMDFLSDPNDNSVSSIWMTARTASDSFPSIPIEYLFTFDACSSDGGTGGTASFWQESTSYTDSGLQVNRCYGYTVTARDSIPNTGTVSSKSTAYTTANIPGVPSLSNPSVSTLDISNSANGNPSSGPTTNFAVQVVTTIPNDSVWLNRWVDGAGDPSASEVWLADSAWDVLTVRSLDDFVTYGFRVKARNQDGNSTALSSEGQGTTDDAFLPASFIRSGGTTGTFFDLDIGFVGTDRLVVIIAGDESAGTNLTGITVDSKSCNFVASSTNIVGIGNHQEMWYCDESDLGASNGTVTIAISGGGSTWGTHALFFTGSGQNGPTDFGVDDTSNAVDTITVTGIDVPADGLVVAGWGEGSGGLTINSQTSPLTMRQDGPDPNSADLFSSSGIEVSVQTNKTYSITLSANHNRATGIVAVWPK